MKYVDYACAWMIFAVGLVAVVLTELRHPPGAVLDTPLLWIFVAMFNFLRLRNDDGVKGLRIFCIGANLSEFAFEVVRIKMWGASLLVVALPMLCETIFSMVRSKPPVTATAV
jgi:hypothetical protein